MMKPKMRPIMQELLELIKTAPSRTAKFYQEELDKKYGKRMVKVDSALYQFWLKGLVIREPNTSGIYEYIAMDKPATPPQYEPRQRKVTKQKEQRAEFLLVSDKTSEILQSSNDVDALAKVAKFIRECGGSCTIFEATNL